MEQVHKNTLRKHRVALVQDMDLTYIFDVLVQRNIFEPADYEDFERDGKVRRKVNQLFLNAIVKRGPNAFRAFVESLRAHKHGALADLLDPSSASSFPSQVDYRPGRVTDHPTDAITGPEGDSKHEPMDTLATPAKSIIASPTEDMKKAAWPWDNPPLVTNVQMEVSPPKSNDASDVDDVYQMQSKPRGLAVIINNKHFRTLKTRTGTDIDRKNLNYVFEKLGFNTIVKNDQTGEQMQQILRDLSSHNHTSFDCFILAILSHGTEGAMYGTDERIVKIENITMYFEGGRCPSLVGKPKVFFLQACRGERFDGGHKATDSRAVAPSNANTMQDSVGPKTDDELAQEMLDREFEDDTDASNAIRAKLPTQSDMLLAYATVPGFVSWRSLEHGSWFVQALSEVLLEHSHKEDLLSMMTKVNNKVARAFESSCGHKKQIPAPVTMLRKKLFFNPGR